ncbi:MAG: N-acetylmuramoyl-L-alanine amidase [Chthoniobacterales bacterium]
MASRSGTTESPIRRTLAWVGFVLMIASAVWWQLLPRRGGVRTSAEILINPVTRVVIDAGHGGNDSGALRADVMEKDLTLDVAQRLDQILRGRGLATTLTRSGDETVSLAKRAELANQEDDCVFVSIHFDEGARASATGVQTFYAARKKPPTRLAPSWLPSLQKASTGPDNLESQSLAGFVQEALVTRTQAFDRGTRSEQFYVVVNVRHPAVLVEGGFISNDADLARLKSEKYRQSLAGAIGDGVLRYRQISSQTQATVAASGARN